MSDSAKLSLGGHNQPKKRIVIFEDAEYRITAEGEYVYFETTDKDRMGAIRWSSVDAEYALRYLLQTLVKNELSLARNRGEAV